MNWYKAEEQEPPPDELVLVYWPEDKLFWLATKDGGEWSDRDGRVRYCGSSLWASLEPPATGHQAAPDDDGRLAKSMHDERYCAITNWARLRACLLILGQCVVGPEAGLDDALFLCIERALRAAIRSSNIASDAEAAGPPDEEPKAQPRAALFHEGVRVGLFLRASGLGKPPSPITIYEIGSEEPVLLTPPPEPSRLLFLADAPARWRGYLRVQHEEKSPWGTVPGITPPFLASWRVLEVTDLGRVTLELTEVETLA